MSGQGSAAMRAVLGSRIIAFYAILARVTGSVAGGVMLSQMAYWADRTTDADGWFWHTRSEWQAETTLSRHQQESVRRRLRKLGVLEEERRGVPARLFYRLDFDRLAELVTAERETIGAFPPTSRRETDQLDGGKVTNRVAENSPTVSKSIIEDTEMDGGGANGAGVLVQFGVSPAVAKRLAAQCGAEQISGWLAYAKSANGLQDPVAFVVRQLLDGEPAPEAARELSTRDRYLGGELGHLLKH